MELAESLARLETVVRPHLKFLNSRDELGPEQSLGEAGLDSMASIDLLLDLEREFDVTIDDELLTENSFATLAEIRKLIEASRAGN